MPAKIVDEVSHSQLREELRQKRKRVSVLKKENKRLSGIRSSANLHWENEIAAEVSKCFRENKPMNNRQLQSLYLEKVVKKPKNDSQYWVWRKRFLKKHRLVARVPMFDSFQPSDGELIRRIWKNWGAYDRAVTRIRKQLRGDPGLVQTVSFDETFLNNFLNYNKNIIPQGERHMPGNVSSFTTTKAGESLGVFLADSGLIVPPVIIFALGSSDDYVLATSQVMPLGTLMAPIGNTKGKHTMDSDLWRQVCAHFLRAVVQHNQRQQTKTHTILIFDAATPHKMDQNVRESDFQNMILIDGAIAGEEPLPDLVRQGKKQESWSDRFRRNSIQWISLEEKTTAFSQPVEVVFGQLKTKLGLYEKDREDDDALPSLARASTWSELERILNRSKTLIGDQGYSVADTLVRQGDRLVGLGNVFPGYRPRKSEIIKLLNRSEEKALDEDSESVESEEKMIEPNDQVLPLASQRASRQSASTAYDRLSQLRAAGLLTIES